MDVISPQNKLQFFVGPKNPDAFGSWLKRGALSATSRQAVTPQVTGDQHIACAAFGPHLTLPSPHKP